MENMIALFQEFFFWFGTLVAAASVIVKATPTQRDDAVLAYFVKALDYLSIFNAKIEKKANDE